MRKEIFTTGLLCMSVIIHAQVGKVGINTNSPIAMLHVQDSSVLFRGGNDIAITPGNPPVSGVGVRMMWYPDKAAFRAGAVYDVNWDKDSIGIYSFAVGLNTKAKNRSSVAMGENTRAEGQYSTALGNGTKALGNFSTALGGSTTASGTSSIAMGANTTASGFRSTAMGSSTNATGAHSTAMGEFSTASGEGSVAMGYISDASGLASVSMGRITEAHGKSSLATGHSTDAYGENSASAGYFTAAYGINSIAAGYFTDAIGENSIAAGEDSRATGDNSTALGFHTRARAFGSLVIGQYNDSIIASSPATWVATDPVFIVGNGSSQSVRSNALTVLKNGYMGISTAAPAYGLHVVNNNSADGGHVQGIMIENIAAAGEAAISFKNQTFLNPDAKWINGLNQGSSLSWDYGVTFGGGAAMVLDTTGNLTIAGTLTQNSDARLKKNINPLQNSLEKILRLNGYQYYWIESTYDKSLQTGVLAQEVEKQMPELVRMDAEGVKSVNYIGITPYFIEAIKELKKENNDLRREMEEFKKWVIQNTKPNK